MPGTSTPQRGLTQALGLNMKLLGFLAICLLAGAVFYAYRLWMRPVDQPTQILRNLEKHFNDHGVPGHIYPVRHDHIHSSVKAVAAFEIQDYPLPFVLVDCANDVAAAAQSRDSQDMPPELKPIRNDLVVLIFPAWGDDTYAMSSRVKQAFMAYRAEP